MEEPIIIFFNGIVIPYRICIILITVKSHSTGCLFHIQKSNTVNCTIFKVFPFYIIAFDTGVGKGIQ